MGIRKAAAFSVAKGFLVLSFRGSFGGFVGELWDLMAEFSEIVDVRMP